MTSLLVTGSRSIKTQALVWACLDLVRPVPALLIHGGATGVDTLAGAWAKSKGIKTCVMRPDTKAWPINKYRWKAYTMRDYAMVDRVERVVAIWDGASHGTKLTLDYAARKGKLKGLFQLKEGRLVDMMK